jgi:hypothetical protein
VRGGKLVVKFSKSPLASHVAVSFQCCLLCLRINDIAQILNWAFLLEMTKLLTLAAVFALYMEIFEANNSKNNSY